MSNVIDFPWAVNKEKLARAVKELRDANVEVTEKAVRELYVSYAGLVVDHADPEPKAKEIDEDKEAKKAAKEAEKAAKK